uniref:NADH-ubiquinone oxidoreductase chain 6 n=1 Tax=Porcellio dilatatus dilatatus TaxID=96810 RepID=A0A1P8DKG2_PORDI|nr:NADH dehydrogenase subunit 6 [Porcellio dilatatus dilatatus]
MLVSKTSILIKLILEVVVLSLSCLVLSICVVLMSSPQVIVVFLVIQAFMISLLSGFLNNIWYSYILFLVFLGGMLVVFIYISSLASSEKVDKKYMWILKMVFMVLLLSFVMVYSNSSWMLMNISHLFYTESKIIYTLVFSSAYPLYIFVVGYLLLSLWIVCMLVKMLNGPLRKLI